MSSIIDSVPRNGGHIAKPFLDSLLLFYAQLVLDEAEHLYKSKIFIRRDYEKIFWLGLLQMQRLFVRMKRFEEI